MLIYKLNRSARKEGGSQYLRYVLRRSFVKT